MTLSQIHEEIIRLEIELENDKKGNIKIIPKNRKSFIRRGKKNYSAKKNYKT